MQVSSTGRHLIESCEGLKLEAYQDQVGVWTIGYGHTSAAGNPLVVSGMTIDAGEADSILSTDLARFEPGVWKGLRAQPNQDEFDAMVSLAFNIGLPHFYSSSVLKFFNRGQIQTAGEDFLEWVYAGGVKRAGLVVRRNRERLLFLTGPGHPFPDISASMPMAHKVDHPDGWLTQAAARLELALRGGALPGSQS